ncbi:hypothetical protein BGZ67_009576, partial [Mortierella alpina]
MFGSHLWPRNTLTLREIIEVAGLFLNFAQTITNPNALVLLCGNVSTLLGAMKRGARKSLDPSSSPEHRKVCDNVASIFTEHGKLWERLDNIEKAKISFEKAQTWSTYAPTADQLHPEGDNKVDNKIAYMAPEIFTQDVILQPFKPKPPVSDARISSTLQLVHCLALLSTIPSDVHAAAAMNETLDEADRNWLKSMTEEADEQSKAAC